MRDDLDDRTAMNTRSDMRTGRGIGTGTIAAIVVAAILIIGALFLWPHDSNQSASNNSPSTVGQSRTAPATTTPAPAPSPAGSAAK
jgi:hypothetical protein